MSTRKSVLITGCSEGGLGDALARAFHTYTKKDGGYRVFATARNPKKMSHFATLDIETVILDVQSQDSIDAAVQHVSEQTGGTLDILINNSGVEYMMPLADADMTRIQDLFDVNVFGNIRVTQAFLPLILKSASRPKSGFPTIVNNTSIASVMSVPMQGIYGGSKAALSAITDSLRVELQPFGIKVVELKTGTVNSRIFHNYNANTIARLPPNSYYELVRDVLEGQMNGQEIMKGAADPDVWAKTVVGSLVGSGSRGPPALIWQGTMSWLVWFVRKVVPHTAVDGLVGRVTGMATLAKRLKMQKS